MKYILVTLIVLILIISPISGKGKCNDRCKSTTYCLSTTGTSCSSDSLVNSTWTVNRFKNNDQVTLKLTAQNVKESEYRMLSMTFKSPIFPHASTNYSCIRSASGSVTLKVEQKSPASQVIPGGWSSYVGGILTCSWSFTMYDNIWPLYYNGGAQLMRDSEGSLELQSGTRRAIVANTVRDLPTYQLKYLKCCNKVHGNGVYLAIFNQTIDNRYLIRVIGTNPPVVTLSLTSKSNGMKLTFNCDFKSHKFEGFVSNRTKTTSITDLMNNFNVYSSYNSLCYWSHPLQLTGAYGKLETVNKLFDMQIIANGEVVYSEDGVSLRNSGSNFVFNILLLIITVISMKLMIQ